MTQTFPRAALRVLALAAAASLAPTALAQDKGVQWEITTKMEMAGVPMAMPATTTRLCLGPNEKEDALVPKQDNCRMTDSRRTGNTLRWRMECSGKDPMSGEGEITYAGDTYAGRMRLTGKSGGEAFDMMQTYSGRKLGECTGTVQQQAKDAQAQSNAQVAKACADAVDKLTWQLVFEPRALCADRRAAFCERVSRYGQEWREPKAYAAYRQQGIQEPGEAFSRCGQDFGAVAKAACARGVETRDWQFVSNGTCDADVRVVGETNCKGRAFTGMDRNLVPLCSRYASLTRGTATASSEDTGQRPAAPTAQDAVTQGIGNAVRKLLPF
jgi:Protein of unknown function (DUF3617)